MAKLVHRCTIIAVKPITTGWLALFIGLSRSTALIDQQNNKAARRKKTPKKYTWTMQMSTHIEIWKTFHNIQTRKQLPVQMLVSAFTISDLFLYNFVTDDKFPESGPIVSTGNNRQMYRLPNKRRVVLHLQCSLAPKQDRMFGFFRSSLKSPVISSSSTISKRGHPLLKHICRLIKQKIQHPKHFFSLHET